MTVLTDIIEVQITRETQAVSRAAFNIPLFLAAHTAFIERARTYTSLAGVAEDFEVGSNAYVAAQRYFGQELVPSTIVIGRRQVDEVDGSVATVANNTTYTVTINGTDYSFVSDASATAIEIVAGLDAAVGALTGITFTDNLDGTFSVATTVPGTAWTISVSANLNIVNVAPTETWPAAISAVTAVNNDWIALNTETHVEADILAIAADIEAREKVYGVSTSDSDVKDAVTTDVASLLKALGYQKTFVLYHPNADTEFPECAWTGYQIQPLPGSNTWAYKTLASVTAYALTSTETTNLNNKNVNTYESIGGVNATTVGKMIGGEFIDVMVGVLWLTSRIRERVWFRLVNSSKIPYTNAGIAIIEAEVRSQLQEGVRNNFLADSPAPTVNVPDALSVAPNLRATRTLEDLSFEARLAGAIHFVHIRGTVFV